MGFRVQPQTLNDGSGLSPKPSIPHRCNQGRQGLRFRFTAYTAQVLDTQSHTPGIGATEFWVHSLGYVAWGLATPDIEFTDVRLPGLGFVGLGV